MKKLKSIDFKALFINHGEKFGFGLIVLIVIMALSGTQWSRFAQTPDELKSKIEQAKARINSPENKWPDATSAKFPVVDFNGQAVQVFSGLRVAKYEFSTNLFWPLYRKKEKAREPEFLAAQHLIADPGLAVLAVRAQPAAGELMANPESATATPAEMAADSDLRPAGGAAQPGANPAFGPGPGPAGGHGPGAPGSAFGISTARPSRPPQSGPMHGSGPTAGHGSASSMMSMEGYGGPGAGGGVKALGKRFIAVRAVIPLKEQIEKAMKALNLSYADASLAIDYTDFILERQMAVAGPDPWSGDWEQVNIQYALEVLEQCDLDLDPVPSELKDAVLTMELPTRLLRYWADSATHPLIKNFKVSEAELEKEQKIQAKLMEEAEKLNLQLEPKVKRKGLAGSVNDLRSIGRALVNSPEASNMMSGMQKYMNEGATGPRMSVPDIQDRLTASGRVYLFRYIDFDVLPGMAYRYRLKLELKNPNLDRPYEEVEDQAVTKGVYRHTGWSNISTPTVVPDTVHYYLKDVERDPVRDEKHSRKPVANIALFKWDADFGTTLFDTLKILNVGQFVSEKKKTWVLDPGTPTYEEKEVALATEDMLVDASGDQELQPELHPDLQLRPERGRKDVKVGMLQEALVVTDAGELKTLDPYSKIGEERDLKRRVDEERKNFLYLKDAPTQTSSALDGPAAAMAQMMGISQPPGRAANPRQKKGAGGPSGGHGSQEGPPTPGPGGRSTPPAGRGARTGRGGGA